MKHAAISLLFWCVTMVAAFADGGLVIARAAANGESIVIFASPVPLRAGPVDFSVLITDEKGAARTEGMVRLEIEAPAEAGEELLPPCCRIEPPASFQSLAMLPGAGGNQLLYESRARLPGSGEWNARLIRTTSDGKTVETRFQFAVNPPAHGLATAWPVVFLPVAALAFLVLHHQAVRKR